MTTLATESGSRTDQLPLFDRLPAEHLFDMYVDLQPAQMIPTAVGTRLTFIARGGVIDGPRLRGEILPGGGDWLLVGTDQVGRIDVRATLRTHDGALIHYETKGVIKIPADGLERLASAERVRGGGRPGRRSGVIGRGAGIRADLCAHDPEIRDRQRAVHVAERNRRRWLQRAVARSHRLPHLPGSVTRRALEQAVAEQPLS